MGKHKHHAGCGHEHDEDFDDEDFDDEDDDGIDWDTPLEPIRRVAPKIGRNEPCPCGSLKKYKKCCL